jgi:hypothetical protein
VVVVDVEVDVVTVVEVVVVVKPVRVAEPTVASVHEVTLVYILHSQV